MKCSTMAHPNPKSGPAYPPPLIVPPLPGHGHTHTIIALHGRGSNGARFGDALLAAATSTGNSDGNEAGTTTLRAILPAVRFVFPTAAPRRAKAFNRAVITQWFDIPPGHGRRGDLLRYLGLAESVAFVRGLVEQEAAALGCGRRVVLLGLSQGMATALHVLLSMDGEGRLGAVVGLSGSLPFTGELRDVAEVEERLGHEDGEGLGVVFESDGVVLEQEKEFIASLSMRQRKQCAVVDAARDILDLPPLAAETMPSFSSVAVFIGHGTEDTKVPIEEAEAARELLMDLGVGVRWKCYEGLGHWWREPDEIDDVVAFLREAVAIERA